MSDLHFAALLLATLAGAPVVLAFGESLPRHAPPPEVIYVDGNIYTLDPARPRAEALGLAGGRIVAVGSNAEVRARVQPETRVQDLGGRTVLPGLIDSHCHVAGLGSYGLGRVDLSAAQSFDDVVSMIAERVKTAEKGAWILGGRWDHESWPQRRLPRHQKLSAVSPDNPVWITRVDGHAGLANAAALELAGVTRDTATPPGGEIIHDSHGELTGLLVDNACELIESKLGEAQADTAALVLEAQRLCLSAGLVGVHDAGVTPAEVDVYRQLAESGQLKMRVYVMVSGRYAQAYFREHGLEIGERLTVRAVKLFADGALGSRGAWLLEPYTDRPKDAEGRPYRGLNVMKPEFLRLIAEDGLQQGYQVCTHAIGDRAIRETLDQYAVALSRHPRKDHRFRIEHAQVVAPPDIPRFAKYGVIPAMQPTHATSDMRWAEARLGPRRVAGAYAWAKIRRTGVPIPAGSDFPVELHNPFLGIYAAITRQDVAGNPPGGWRPEERMTRQEVLRSFTLDAAYAAFEEEQKGSLEVGKLADFVVIDRDVMTCEPREIIETRVLQTVIGGEVVYRALQQ